MKTETVGKIATALIVLSLVLSGLMALQFSARADERQEGTVEGIISTEDASIPRGLEVHLIDLSEGKIETTETSRGGYFRFDDVDVGHYRVEFPSQSHKEQHVYFRSRTDVRQVERDETREFDLEVERSRLDYVLNGTVLDENEAVVEGTEVTLRDMDSDYTETVGLYNETSGEYRIPVYEGNFIISASAPDYPDIVHEIEIEGDEELNITLTDDPDSMVTGYIWSEDGAVTSPLRVTIYNETTGEMFYKAVEEGPYFEITLPKGGDYVLIVDSDGYLPYYREDLSVPDEGIRSLGRTEEVQASADEEIHTRMEFDENWDSLDITRNRTYQPDTMMLGMDYSDIGLLAFQIDMAFGDGDLELDYSELQDFKEELEYIESNIPSSHRLITVDGVAYSLVNYTFELEFPGLEEDGDSVGVFDLIENPQQINSTSVAEYEPVDDIDVETRHDIDLHLEQDHVVGNYRDYTYEIKLPDGYERTNFVDNVDMTGFTTVNIDTFEGVGKTHVELNVEQSEPGEVNIILEEGPRVYLKEIEENDEVVDYYIVRDGTNVTCTADFVDPVGSEEDAEFTWYFDDQEIGTGSEIDYEFIGHGEGILKVEVLETGGHITTDELTVFVDGRAPEGEIEGDFEVKEGEEVSLSAYNFTDEGEIGYYEWNFTDGTDPIEGPDLYNVTHTFDLYGTFNVQLNITDVVGNWEIYEQEIEVIDNTPPVPMFNLTYQTEDENITIHSDDLAGDSIARMYPITLDASESYDPPGFDDEEGEIESYEWWIEEDGFEHDGMILEDYEFEDVGVYTISLNVTDQQGNWENISREVRIVHGPTPDLELRDLRISGTRRINEELTISVNVTNIGQAIAEDIRLTFAVDGETITPTPEMTFEKDGEDTNDTIQPDEEKKISFTWTPEDDGEFELNVTIIDGNEPEELQVDNTLIESVRIEPPAWRRYIVYAVIPIVIIGVTVGLYFYKEKFRQ